MVSIIVPVYNVKDYLDRCMNSILNQTFKDIEVILINDGSTDKSDELCIEWQKRDSRIVYISKKNEGLGPTRNVGVSIARGEYINFVDSDDWIEEDAIESMYNAAQKSNADIVLSDINYVTKGDDGNLNVSVSKLRIDSEVPIDSSIDTRFIDKARLTAWGKLYKRDFYINSKIEQPAHAFEDASVIPLLIAKANIIFHVPKPLYNYYRGRKESIVNDFSCYTDLRKTLEDEKTYFKRDGLFDKYYDALEKIAYAQVRFIYKKVLGDNKEIDEKNKCIIDELYKFMDNTYPKWVNIDKYSIGFSGKDILKTAVKNTVFNDFRVENGTRKVRNLVDKDLLIINLVDELFYKDIELWSRQVKEDLMYLQENFKGKHIVLVKFINEDYKKQSEIIDDIYREYEKVNLNVSVIDFDGNDDEYDESASWDLSDEILRVLK